MQVFALQITLLVHPSVSTCATVTAEWDIIRVCVYVAQLHFGFIQGSHASYKVLNFFLKFAGPGKSWKISFVLESPGN